MSQDLNQVNLLGRLGKDPEIKYLQTGAAVCNFSLATKSEWKDKSSGEKKSKTEWHSVVVWGKLGEICAEHLFKGSRCFVSGSLETREWTDKNENKRSKTEIKAREVIILDFKNPERPTAQHDEQTNVGHPADDEGEPF